MRTLLCVNTLQMAQGGENLSLANNIILIEAANIQVRSTGNTQG
jgi:hypothetical protein